MGGEVYMEFPPISAPEVPILVYIYTTFLPHFKGKKRCIKEIIALVYEVLRNALTRNGGSIYKLYPS